GLRGLHGIRPLSAVDPGDHPALALPAVAPAGAGRQGLVGFGVLPAGIVGTGEIFAGTVEAGLARALELRDRLVDAFLAQQADAEGVARRFGLFVLGLRRAPRRRLHRAEVVVVVPMVAA